MDSCADGKLSVFVGLKVGDPSRAQSSEVGRSQGRAYMHLPCERTVPDPVCGLRRAAYKDEGSDKGKDSLSMILCHLRTLVVVVLGSHEAEATGKGFVVMLSLQWFCCTPGLCSQVTLG